MNLCSFWHLKVWREVETSRITLYMDFTGKGLRGEIWKMRASRPRGMRQSRGLWAAWRRMLDGQEEVDLDQGKKNTGSSRNMKAVQKDSRRRWDTNQNYTEHISIKKKNAWHFEQPNGLQNSLRCLGIPKDNWFARPSLTPLEAATAEPSKS